MPRDIHKFLETFPKVPPLPPEEKAEVVEPGKKVALISQAAELGGAEPAVAPEGADWAIVVTHGMGQQVHFETLEQIARSLWSAELRAQGAAQEIVPRVVRLRNGMAQGKEKETEVLRAEMNVTGADGKPRTVHVYESYWAPLTEGKASLRSVTAFLLESFARGFWFLLRYRKFDRWEFGGMKDFGVRFFLSLSKLVFGLLLFFGPIALANFLTAGQVFALLFHWQTGRNLLKPFTYDVIWIEIFAAIFAAGVLVFPKLYRAKFLAGRDGLLSAARTGLKILAILVCLAGLAGALRAEVVLVWHAWLWYGPHAIEPPAGFRLRIEAIVWLAALAAGLVSRWFLVEYMGDVAIYVTSFKVSQWDEVRDKIKKTVADLVGAVYSARSGPDGQGELLYPNVMVVGHSLGSVISYDTLNSLALQDELATLEGRKQEVLGVAERTKLLLTFGSPLDKVAFLFRTKGNTDELREAAASAAQPLICDYAFRPAKWINIWSWFDIISGKLHYYDNPDGAGGGKRVADNNIFDKEAFIPLVAHTEYWHDDLLGDTLYENL